MKTIKLSDYEVGPNDKFIFDTNIWLLLYGPIAGAETKKQKKYSSLFRKIADRKANIYITSLIVSEYINVVLRLGFKQWQKEDRNGRINSDFKKDYRATEHYQSTLNDAIDQITAILECTDRRPDDFHNIDINSMLKQLDQTYDYNDAYIVKCCERDNITLVSDDADLVSINSKIKLITI